MKEVDGLVRHYSDRQSPVKKVDMRTADKIYGGVSTPAWTTVINELTMEVRVKVVKLLVFSKTNERFPND